MKKTLFSVLILVMLVSSFVGFAPVEQDDFVIGILTGTVSQGEEEFRAAEKMAAKYPGQIITATYPDNFSSEVETTIARTLELASNGADLIVFVQAVPGAAAAIEKVHEIYPDFPFITGVAGEDPDVIASKADVVLGVAEIAMGTKMAEQAAAMGAKTFIHYSFPRHMSYATIVARHEILKARCEELGILFVDATAPDPTGDSGVTGAQQFILEDLPRQVALYGQETAFFNTNCGMQPAMIQAILATGAYYPQQCCPSPYHGYPEALGIAIPEDKQGDVAYILEQIEAKVAEAGLTGHFSTWPVPVNMMMVEAGVEYGFDYLAGEYDTLVDYDHWTELFEAVAGDYKVEVSPLELNDVVYDNYLQILSDYITF